VRPRQSAQTQSAPRTPHRLEGLRRIALSPTPVAGNCKVPSGDSDTPAGATPTPFNAMFWLRYWSDTVSTPASWPTLFGAKATSSVQVECPLSELPQLFTTVKSPLAICAAISSSAESPELVSVTCCAALAVFKG
jgi:hypothetical protein